MNRLNIALKICLLFLLSIDCQAQTIFWSDNFDAPSGGSNNNNAGIGWSAGAPTPGGGNNGSLLGTSNNWTISNNASCVASNKLYVRAVGLLGSPANSYLSDIETDKFISTPNISTVGASNIDLTFTWRCDGVPGSDYGLVGLSNDGGATWNWLTSTEYSGTDNCITTTFPIGIAYEGIANLKIAFRFISIATSCSTCDPPFNIDNIELSGIINLTNSITTGTITGSPFCAGSTFNVPFTSTGTFTAGNIYTAQLSDASGSFASPTNIGTLNSTANTGTISVTIPVGTPTGSGYLIRIISSNPAITGLSSLAFTINAPFTPTFNALANVCQNATAPVLPTSSTNGTPITGTWAPAVSTASVGTTVYTFTPTAGQCATATTLSLTVDPTITPTFNTIADVCQNATAPVLPTSSTNGTPITGTWAPTVSTANAGTTDYTFTPTAGQCATTTTLSITVDPTITPTFNTIPDVCQNATAPVLPTSSTNGTPITGTWAPAVSTANAGTTDYTFTPTAGQCATTTTLSITVLAPQTPTFNAIGPLCLSASAPGFSNSSTNTTPITGTWNPSTINTSIVGITAYAFTPDAGQCATATTMDIEITNSITPTFAAIGPLCLGAIAPSLPLSSTNLPVIAGTWNPAVINTGTVGISTYTFTPDAGQCAGTTALDIEITNSITPTFATIGPFCQNSPTVLLPQSSSNSPAITGTWTPFISVNTVAVGTSTYTFTPDAGQCASATTVDIEITAPNITPTFTPIGPLCLNASAPSLPINSNNASPITGTWNPSTINTAIAGIITFTFTPDAGQCATIGTMDIVITTSIIPTFASIGPLCLGSIAPSLPISSTNTPTITGTWSPSTINTASIGTLTYNFTADPNQCASNTSIDIEVTNSITPTFATIAPICQGASAPVLPSSSTNSPAITGTWNPASINTGITGITSYTFTPDAGQCGANTSIDVEVISAPPAPSISISASVTTICAGQSVDFTATPNSSNTGDVIQWFINGNPVTGGTGLLFSSNTLNNNDQITAVFTPSSSCLAGQNATSNLIIITVNPSVTPTISISTTNTQICVGDNVTFNTIVNGGGSAPLFQWFINNNAVAGATSNTFSSSTLSNLDAITVQLTSNLACAVPNTATSNSLTIFVSPYGTPSISITADRNVICVGQEVNLFATLDFGGAAPQFNWQVGGNNFTTSDPSFTISGMSASATVSCTLTSNYACLTTNTATSNNIDIQVNPIPSVALSEDVTIQEGESTTLTATATANMTYLWTPTTSLTCSDCLTPTASPTETTVYTFNVTDPATNCNSNDSLKVTVIRNYDIWVPTAFSPNEDGNNDYFFVRGNNVKDFTIRLFDRWGNKVFETSNLAEGWNGEYQNRLINSGILVYVLNYTLNDGTTETIKGNITVSN